jgi:hypothetical protein
VKRFKKHSANLTVLVTLLALSLLIAGCAKVKAGKDRVKSTGSNPFLWQNSAWPIAHSDTQASDSTRRFAMPTGNIKAGDLEIRHIPFNMINWGMGHAQYPDGVEIAWLAGPQMIGKARLDGGRFELIDTISPPGLEDLSKTPEAMKKLVADLDAAGADDAKIRELYLKQIVATRAYNYFNGIYTFVDKDDYFYSKGKRGRW